jgi:4-amino-4-deoxy-L-arabinose transferase-like glycosyltransferase
VATFGEALDRRRIDRVFFAALVVGTLLRILPLAIWPEEACVRDECSYVRIAEKIANGKGMTAYGGWLWAPGYPTFLAIHKVLTGWCSPAKATQIAVSALNTLLLFRLGERIAGVRAARFAVWFYALSPSLIFYTISLWSETLYTTFFLGTFVALDRVRKDERVLVPALVLGALAGLLVLFRGIALYMVPIWALGVLWGRWRDRRAWTSAVVAIAIAIATVAPYSMMISTKYDAPIVSDRTLGQMMWLGNNDFEPITFDYGGPLSARRFNYLETTGRPVCASRLKVIARDNCQTQEGFAWIKAHPGQFVFRMPERLAQMMTPHSLLTRHLRWGSWRGLSPALGEVIVVWGAAMSVLAMLGGAVGLALWAEGALGVTFVAVTLYNLAAIAALAGLSRYRAPLEPILAIYCGMLLPLGQSVARVRAVPWRGIVALTIFLALVPLVLWYLPSGWPRWRSW